MRRCLDDARNVVGLAFSKIWENSFTKIWSRYDESGTTVQWNSFKEALEAHINIYVQREGHDAVQIRSAFQGIELAKKRVTGNPVVSQIDTQMARVIRRGVPKVQDKQSQLVDWIVFFLPVFIWKYNEAKESLVSLDHEVFELEGKIFQGKKFIAWFNERIGRAFEEPIRPLSPSPVKHRFHVGTALDIRESKNWKDYLADCAETDELGRVRNTSSTGYGPDNKTTMLPGSSRQTGELGKKHRQGDMDSGRTKIARLQEGGVSPERSGADLPASNKGASFLPALTSRILMNDRQGLRHKCGGSNCSRPATCGGSRGGQCEGIGRKYRP